MPKDELLPVGVTSRSSRRSRRRGGKENMDEDVTIELDDSQFDMMKENKKKDSAKASTRTVLSSFRRAAKSTSQDFLMSNTSLMECIVDASMCITEETDGFLLLEENTVDLLSACRKVIKEATESNESSDILARFCVGVHGLRALCRRLSGSKRDAVIKLFYHIIATADGLCNRSKDTAAICQAASYAVASYEALAYLLQDYALESSKDNKSIVFRTPKQSKKEASVVTLPLPETKVRGKRPDAGGLSLGDLSTIAIQSTMCIARILIRLWGDSKTLNAAASVFRQWKCSSFHRIGTDKELILSASVYLVRRTAVEWISFLAIHAEKDCTKDVVSQCKQGYRLLWDVGSKLAKEDADSSLQLRQDAIAVFLLDSREDLPSRIKDSLASRHFDSACASAWKATAAYVHEASLSCPVSSSHPLHRYHEEVGRLLDSYASKECLLSYIEYCAYRALHSGLGRSSPCTSDRCLFTHLPFLYAHEVCDGTKDVDGSGATLSLFFLSLCIKHSLERKDPVGDDGSLPEFIEGAHSIVTRFRAQVVGDGCGGKAEHMSRLRYFKLLSMLSLHLVVFRITDSENWDSSQANLRVLELGADILAGCMGPLAHSLAMEMPTENGRLPQLWNSFIDAYLRSIAVFDKLHSTVSTESLHLSRADSIICELAENLTCRSSRRTSPAQYIEKAAKTIASIGRRRLEQSDSIIPLLVSIQLFTHLARNSSKSASSFQLSARWSFLASVYRSGNFVGEASVATVFALLYGTIEEPSNEVSVKSGPEVELIQSLGLSTKGIISTGCSKEYDGDQRKGMIARLVQMLLGEAGSFGKKTCGSENPSAFSVKLALQTLLKAAKNQCPVETSFEECCGVSFGLGSLLQVAFPQNVVSEEQSVKVRQVLAEKIKILGEVLVRLGLHMQTTQLEGKEECDALLVEYNHVLRLAASYVKKLVPDDEYSTNCTFLSTLYTVASVSLLSCHPALEFDRWGSGDEAVPMEIEENQMEMLMTFAYRLAGKARQSLSQATGEQSHWQLLATGMLPALDLYSLQLSCLQHHAGTSAASNEILSGIKRAVEALQYTSDSDLVGISKHCTVSTLSKICDWLSLDGEELRAAQVADWSSRISRNMESTIHTWLQAKALSLSVLTNTDSRDLQEGNIVSGDVQGTCIELLACELRTQASQSTDRSELNAVAEKLTSLLTTVDATVLPKDTSYCLLLWAKSTILLGLAETYMQRGDLESCLSWLKESLQCCNRVVVVYTKQPASSFSPVCNVTFADRIATATLLIRCKERQTFCLQQISRLYARLGDYRKAEGYSLSAVELVDAGMALYASESKLKFSDCIAYSRREPCHQSRAMKIRRSFLQAKARASAVDIAREVLDKTDDGVLSIVKFAEWRSRLSLNRDVEEILDLLTVFFLLSDGDSLTFVDGSQKHCVKAREMYERLIERPEIGAIAQLVASPCYWQVKGFLPSVHFDLKLAEARNCLLQRCCHGTPEEQKALAICKETADSPFAPSLSRAWASYLLGLSKLRSARKSGALNNLWRGASNIEATTGEDDGSQSIVSARKFFILSLSLLGRGSDMLIRSVLRCLALVLGPESPELSGKVSAMSACAMIHASIGNSGRRRIARILADREDLEHVLEGYRFSIGDVFTSLDVDPAEPETTEHFFQEVRARLPHSWRFIAIALCPAGELLINSLELSENGQKLITQTVCIFPEVDEHGDYLVHAYDEIVKPLDTLIQNSEDQLQGIDEEVAYDRFGEEQRKREWWKDRKNLDSDLQDLTERVDEQYFGCESAQLALHGRSRLDDLPCGNLASRFEAASVADTHVKSEGVEDTKDVSASLRKTRSHQSEHRGRTQRRLTSDSCTFLILDENLSRFPFEGMPSLEGETLCRLPSLSFVLAKLVEIDKDQGRVLDVNPEQTRFILDPESNLGGTKDRMSPFIESLSSRHSCPWRGTVGSAPTAEFIEEALTTEAGLLLFFGHGGGQSYYSRSQLEKLIGSKDQASDATFRRGKASIVLMGCSSGRLVSVNRKDTRSVEQLPIHYEPEGIALSYLSAGAPCVVGNLWDVTDRDIDRFSMAMLEEFFGGEDNPSLAKCVANARSACKMKYIVGCAPVCYGIPVHLLRPGEA